MQKLLHGLEVVSRIESRYPDLPFAVEYHLRTDAAGMVVLFELFMQQAGTSQQHCFERGIDARWRLNGQPVPAFNGCTDIGISLTPLAHTLTLLRLGRIPQPPRTVKVLYVDVLQNSIHATHHRYSWLSSGCYLFETIPAQDTVALSVDENMLVTNYPDLFVRVQEDE